MSVNQRTKLQTGLACRCDAALFCIWIVYLCRSIDRSHVWVVVWINHC